MGTKISPVRSRLVFNLAPKRQDKERAGPNLDGCSTTQAGGLLVRASGREGVCHRNLQIGSNTPTDAVYSSFAEHGRRPRFPGNPSVPQEDLKIYPTTTRTGPMGPLTAPETSGRARYRSRASRPADAVRNTRTDCITCRPYAPPSSALQFWAERVTAGACPPPTRLSIPDAEGGRFAADRGTINPRSRSHDLQLRFE